METLDRILESAQRLLQQRGFNGFSYADIANEIGIRKASLHHYFPSKVDLGLKLIEKYSQQFDQELSQISESLISADAKLSAYVALYRNSLEANRMCLCGMLASEVLTLDIAMLPRLKSFFTHNTEWLTEVFAAGKSQKLFSYVGTTKDHARIFLSTLQGALLIARATGNNEEFDKTTSILIKNYLQNDQSKCNL